MPREGDREPVRRPDAEVKALARKMRDRCNQDGGEAGVALGALLALEWIRGDDSAMAEIERRVAP